MLKLTGSQKIEGFRPREVFEAGARAENLPQLGSLALTVLKQQEKLEKDTEIGVDFNFPTSLPGFSLPDSIKTTVKQCEPGELMRIEGVSEDETLAVMLLLELQKFQKGIGTEITHTLELDYRVSRFKTLQLKAAELALRIPIELEVKEFSKHHVNNIKTYLGTVPTVTSKSKKQLDPALKGVAA